MVLEKLFQEDQPMGGGVTGICRAGTCDWTWAAAQRNAALAATAANASVLVRCLDLDGVWDRVRDMIRDMEPYTFKKIFLRYINQTGMKQTAANDTDQPKAAQPGSGMWAKMWVKRNWWMGTLRVPSGTLMPNTLGKSSLNM